MKRLLLLTLALGLFFIGTTQAATLNVPGQYSEIQDAMDASVSGDVILVAAGTYNDCTHPTEGPESTPACVIMKTGVTLRGAGIDQTIIDAEGLGRGIFIEYVENCTVENLTVTNAYANIYGAGILARHVDTTVAVTDVRVTTCTDGGVICINEGSPTLTRVIMDYNEAKQGGGLAIEENSSPAVIDCVVDMNESPSGAGVFIRNGSNPTITGCTISNNTITSEWGHGGGISIQGAGPVISDCQILNNTCLGYGGGVNISDASTGSLDNCLIQGNDAAFTYSLGGGISVNSSDPVLTNLIVVGNTASGFYAEGGGLDISFSPSPVVENCTIVGNSTSGNGFAGGIAVSWGANPAIDKCIISGSTAGAGIHCNNDFPGAPVVSCSNIYGNADGDELCGTDGGGNFSADPLFCGTEGHEYGLTGSSPCAPGNHPGGLCDGALIGAVAVGCGGGSPAPMPGLQGLVLGNHPNPFNPSTTIYFDLPQAGPATLRIFDVAGRLVQERSWDSLPQGRSEFQWNGLDRQGRALSSGVFLYRLDTRDDTLSRRMSLIR